MNSSGMPDNGAYPSVQAAPRASTASGGAAIRALRGKGAPLGRGISAASCNARKHYGRDLTDALAGAPGRDHLGWGLRARSETPLNPGGNFAREATFFREDSREPWGLSAIPFI